VYKSNRIYQLRKRLARHLGQPVCFIKTKGRVRTAEQTGVLVGVYANVFTIRVTDKQKGTRMLSFCYSDLIAANIKLRIGTISRRIEHISAD
jgi:uncharacterized protein Veg